MGGASVSEADLDEGVEVADDAEAGLAEGEGLVDEVVDEGAALADEDAEAAA